MSKRIKSKIHKIRPKKSIFKNLWFWIIFLFLVVVISGSYFVLFYSGFQLKNIIISGNIKVGTQDLHNITSEYATTGLINFWNIKITSTSIFLINEDRINDIILKNFPEIEKITINKELPETLILDVTERKQIGAFCPPTGSGQTNGNCFLIDNNGVVFEPITSMPANITIIRQPTQNGQIYIGQQVIAQNIISAIYSIQKDLKDNFKINLKEVTIPNQLKLYADTSENWQVYFDLGPGSDINSQLTKLNLLLGGGISVNSKKNLRYINLMPQNKAIICDNKICGG